MGDFTVGRKDKSAHSSKWEGLSTPGHAWPRTLGGLQQSLWGGAGWAYGKGQVGPVGGLKEGAGGARGPGDRGWWHLENPLFGIQI